MEDGGNLTAEDIAAGMVLDSLLLLSFEGVLLLLLLLGQSAISETEDKATLERGLRGRSLSCEGVLGKVTVHLKGQEENV